MQFAPSVYEHCARLIERTPWDVSRDADLLFAGQAEAFVRYRHAPVVGGVDIYNLEADQQQFMRRKERHPGSWCASI